MYGWCTNRGVPTFNHVSARKAIDDRGITVAEMGRRIGVDRAVLSNILNGNRKGSMSLARKFAEVTGENPYTYIGPDDPRTALIQMCVEFGITPDDLRVSA